jgi:TP901 family phage tail tape measure protein
MVSSRNLVEVGISMVLQDQFSANASQIAGSFGAMMSQIQTASQAALGTWKPLIGAGTAILSSYTNAVREFAEVQNELFLVQKMSGASAEDMKGLTQLTRDINMEVPLTAQDIASAEKYLAMAGNSASDIENLIRPVAQLSSVLQVAAGGKGGTADMLTNIMKMFQLPTENATAVADDLFTAVTNSNMSLQDLQDSFKYAGAEAHASGLSMQETAAAIGLLGDIGIQGSSAGTALANSLRYLKQSITGYKKNGLSAMNALGISPEQLVDAKGNLKDLSTIYQTFFEAAKKSGYGNVELTNLFNQIFGVRGNRNMLSVVAQLGDQNNAYNKIMAAVQANDGILNTTTEERLDTVQGKIDQLTSALNNLHQGVGEALEGPFKSVLTLLTGITRVIYNITQNSIGAWLVKTVAIGVAVGVIINSIRMLQTFFRVLNLLSAQLSGSANGTAGAIGRGNGAASMMEGHLRMCLLYMRQMATMQMMGMMTPGQNITMGNVMYGIGNRGSRKGQPYVRTMGANGTWGRANYNPTVVQRTVTPAVINTSRPSFVRNVGSAVSKGAGAATKFGMGRALGAIGSMGLGLMGGPIGLGITAIATFGPMIYDAIKENTNEEKEQTKQMEQERIERLNSMSAGEYQKEKELEQITAIRKVLEQMNNKNKDKDIQVVINGVPITVPADTEVDASDLFGGMF